MRRWYRQIVLLVMCGAAGSWIVALQPKHDVRVPGEFERQEALVLAGHRFIREAPSTFAQLIKVASGRLRVLVLVKDQQDRKLAERVLLGRGVSPGSVEFLTVNHTTMWIRDYGPVMAISKQGRPLLIDSYYARVDLGTRGDDDEAPEGLASQLNLPIIKSPMNLDGGNILTNGEGLCVTTLQTIEENELRGMKEADVVAQLRRCYGMRDVVVLEPVVGEDTGHADMFLTFTSPDTAVVAECDPAAAPENAAILNRNAARLAQVRTSRGPLRVVRIPMDDLTKGAFRTYTNVVYANGVLLVPSYAEGDPEKLRQALNTYAKLLPKWQIVPAPATELMWQLGSLRCVVMNLPSLGRPYGPQRGS